MGYCALDDVHLLAGSARAFVIVPRAWNSDNGRSGDAIDISTGTIRMAGHGYTVTDRVEFLLVGNLGIPGTGGAFPGGAPMGRYLYPLPIDSVRFQLSTTANGSPLTFSSAGFGWALQIDPDRRLQRHIDDSASRIDEHLTAYNPPLATPYPLQVVGLNARMAYRSAIPSLQFEVAAFRQAADRMIALEASDNAMLGEWLAGKPINPQTPDQDTIPNDAAFAGRDRAPVSWRTGAL